MLINILIALAIFLLALSIFRLFQLLRLQSENVIALQQQLAALCEAAVGSDERVVRFEQKLGKLREQQNTLNLGGPAQQGYEHAIRLARKGVGVDQIIENCNLSDEEARLISRLHGLSQRGEELH